ncbi:MAG: 2Fe-2S iron-sulfur cluster binding domain-containing protein [Burkholderiaceae bacterium]|nr:2Fe-2S iron-sulfur cluster binding domain-containing protein [Burkholderiaceae bacterium]
MSYRVHVLGTDEAFEVNEDESILDGALRANVKMAHECQFGGCGTCRIKLEAGSVRYDEFPMALTEEEAAQGYALACQARPVSDVTLSAAKKGPTFAEPLRVGARLSAVQPLSADIVHLTLELPADTPLDYRPGQYMNILLDDGTSRSFSMASSAVNGNLVDFHVRQIPGGHFTQQLLTALPAGSALNIEMPLGTFCYHEDDWRPLVMVANGTGLAPIKAILESLLDNDDCPPVSLYWGMRTEEELYLRDEIESWKNRLYEFNFVPVLSKGGPQWQGRRGHVQQAVAQDFNDLSEHAIYLCGSPNMIGDAKSLFAQHGADLDYMYADSFTFQYQTEAAA